MRTASAGVPRRDHKSWAAWPEGRLRRRLADLATACGLGGDPCSRERPRRAAEVDPLWVAGGVHSNLVSGRPSTGGCVGAMRHERPHISLLRERVRVCPDVGPSPRPSMITV